MDSASSKPGTQIRGYHLCLILVFFLTVALWKLPSQGFFDPDEGYYLLGAKTIKAAIEYVRLKLTTGTSLGLKEFLRLHGGDVPVGAKHGFYILGGLSMTIWGTSPFAVNFVNILASIALLTGVFRLGNQLEPRGGGLAAAGIISLSTVFLFMSRTVLANPVALALIIWAIHLQTTALYEENRPAIWRPFAVGLLAGGAFTVHYSMLPLILFILAGEALFLTYSHLARGRGLWLSRGAMLILGMLVFPLILEAATRAIRAFVQASGAVAVTTGDPFQFQSYLEQVMRQFRHSAQWGIHLDRFLFYPAYFWNNDGKIFTLLALSGIGGLAWQGVREHSALALYLLWGFATIFAALTIPTPHMVSRVSIYFIPFAALGAGILIVRLWNALPGAAAFIFVLMAAEFAANAGPVIHARSRFSEAVSFMARSGNPKHLSMNSTKSAYYAGLNNVIIAEKKINIRQALEIAKKNNARWLLVDGTPYFSPPWAKTLVRAGFKPSFSALEIMPPPRRQLGDFVRSKLWVGGKKWPFETRVYDTEAVGKALKEGILAP